MKKASFLLLCVLLLLTGCARKESSSQPDRSILPASLRELSFEEHMDISISFWEIEDMAMATEKDAFTQYIEKLFNVTIYPTSVTWSDYKERYQILSATNSLPDVFSTLTLSSNDSNDNAAFVDMIENGSIRALPEDLSSFPILNGLLESTSYTRYKDGFCYAIPRISFLDPILGATDAALLVRRDWMDKLGFQDPKSFEDFLSMTAAFASRDPDGNGVDDTIGYNVNNLPALGKWVILGIAPECNVYSWIKEDSRYVPSWTTEQFRDVVSCYRRLYESGGLDPDFYCKTYNGVLEDFAAGRLGAIEHKSSPATLMELKVKWNELNDLPFEECVDVLPIFPAPDGVCYSNSSSAFWSESFLSSSVDDQKAERILALFEFLLSDRGIEICRYGIPDVDYEKDGNGDYRCLWDSGDMGLISALNQKYPSLALFSDIATWDGGWIDFEPNEINQLRFGEDVMRLSYKDALWARDHSTQLERPYDFLCFPKEPSELFSTAQAFQAFVRCIIGGEDPLEMWDQVLDEMRAQGLEEYIDRQNALFNASKGQASN